MKFKSIFKSRIGIAIIFFFIGYFSNIVLFKVNNSQNDLSMKGETINQDRIPVNPEDFDHQQMLKSFKFKIELLVI